MTRRPDSRHALALAAALALAVAGILFSFVWPTPLGWWLGLGTLVPLILVVESRRGEDRGEGGDSG